MKESATVDKINSKEKKQKSNGQKEGKAGKRREGKRRLIRRKELKRLLQSETLNKIKYPSVRRLIINE